MWLSERERSDKNREGYIELSWFGHTEQMNESKVAKSRNGQRIGKMQLILQTNTCDKASVNDYSDIIDLFKHDL